MRIETYEQTACGTTRVYVKDAEIALAITTLTGRKTLQESDITALRFLGVEVEREA